MRWHVARPRRNARIRARWVSERDRDLPPIHALATTRARNCWSVAAMLGIHRHAAERTGRSPIDHRPFWAPRSKVRCWKGSWGRAFQARVSAAASGGRRPRHIPPARVGWAVDSSEVAWPHSAGAEKKEKRGIQGGHPAMLSRRIQEKSACHIVFSELFENTV